MTTSNSESIYSRFHISILERMERIRNLKNETKNLNDLLQTGRSSEDEHKEHSARHKELLSELNVQKKVTREITELLLQNVNQNWSKNYSQTPSPDKPASDRESRPLSKADNTPKSEGKIIPESFKERLAKDESDIPKTPKTVRFK